MFVVNKFNITPDALSLIFDIECSESEYMHKIELWNYDDDVVVEVELTDTSAYVIGENTYNVSQSFASTVLLSSIPLDATMICGTIHTLFKTNNTLKENPVACSNVRDVYFLLVSKLSGMKTLISKTRYLPMSLNNSINLLQNSLFAHSESLRLGLLDDAKYFYSILTEIYNNERI
jgi:hypothetical protein